MDYKAYALMAILLASVASVALVGVAYAQTTSLTVQTDKGSYSTGDKITVTGKLTATNINQPILVQVLNPQGGRVTIDQINAAADGSYTFTFTSGGPYMANSGTYKVMVSYKGTTTQQTTFDFTSTATPGGGNWKTFNIKVGDKTYPVQYQITGGSLSNMVPDENTATLTVTISATNDGNLKIRLPRNVIDSRAGADGKSGDDKEFAIFADEESKDYDEATPTVDYREVSMNFDQGTQTVEIVGSWAIPEFGAITAIILAVAIVGIIVATATYSKKFNFAPRL